MVIHFTVAYLVFEKLGNHDKSVCEQSGLTIPMVVSPSFWVSINISQSQGWFILKSVNFHHPKTIYRLQKSPLQHVKTIKKPPYFWCYPPVRVLVHPSWGWNHQLFINFKDAFLRLMSDFCPNSLIGSTYIFLNIILYPSSIIIIYHPMIYHYHWITYHEQRAQTTCSMQFWRFFAHGLFCLLSVSRHEFNHQSSTDHPIIPIITVWIRMIPN